MTVTPAEWARVKTLFSAAVTMPPHARSAYLAEACGEDRSLLAQVEALLAASEQTRSFLETPPHLSTSSDDSPAVDLQGRTIGPYDVGSRIGSGGMGDVYKARDRRLNRTVAIKVLPPHVAADPHARERFDLEALAVAALNHPHVCALYDVGHADDVHFLVMEYLDGETLASRLERGPLKIAQAMQYGIEIASALDRVHRAGIVHRDLKPGNIMLTRAGAKLLDFGLSKAERTPSMAPGGFPEPVGDLTEAGTILGTMRYMAPEQIAGNRADARADIFAFGSVLYEMLSGRKAFHVDAGVPVSIAIREREPEPLPGVPTDVDRIVRTCLEKDPDDRWQTARDLERELRWAAERLGAAETSAPRRSRALPWAVAVAALACGLGVAAYYASRPPP